MDFTKLPITILNALKALLSIFFIIMCCAALYSYKPVRDTIDPVASSVSKNTPAPIKKTVEKVAVSIGLKSPPKTYKSIFLSKIKGIPNDFLSLFRGGFQLAFSKLLDTLFHPISILILIFTIYLKARG